MRDQPKTVIGIAIYYLSTGLCIGGITPQGSAEGFIDEDTVLEALPLSDLEKIVDREIPSRCLKRRGAVIGTFMDEPIHDHLLMESGQRFEFDGTLTHPLDLTLLQPGRLLLLPGMIYSSK